MRINENCRTCFVIQSTQEICLLTKFKIFRLTLYIIIICNIVFIHIKLKMAIIYVTVEVYIIKYKNKYILPIKNVLLPYY